MSLRTTRTQRPSNAMSVVRWIPLVMLMCCAWSSTPTETRAQLRQRSNRCQSLHPFGEGRLELMRCRWIVSSCVPLPCFPSRATQHLEEHAEEPGAEAISGSGAEEQEASWDSIFDGESLTGWKSSVFGGEGSVAVEDNSIVMRMGVTLTGVTYQGEVPKSNYEISLDAKLIDGIDFFCGLTFPVAESHCSFIVGGWAGSVVGLSSIDGLDASENETTRIMRFDRDVWYRIRVRVEDDRIQCWIDDEQIVDQSIVDRAIGIRTEVGLSRPLGISAFQTTAAIRDIKIRMLQEK